MNFLHIYTFLQWAIFFMTYSILGWFFESAYCSLKTGKLLNRGFCRGPWVPIYGIGATLLVLISSPWQNSLLIIFLFGFIGGSLLELVSGVLLYRIFHIRWWDYSHNPFNFHGYISFFSSLAWGFMAISIIRFIQPHIVSFSANWSYSMFLVINTMLYTLFAEDVAISICAAFDLRHRLELLTANSQEIERLKISIRDIYDRLNDARAGISASASTVKNIQKTAGTAAAARAAMAETIYLTRAMTNKPFRAAKNSFISFAGGGKRLLLLQKEKLEHRLALLRGWTSEKTGLMSYWSRSFLRNHPEIISRESSLEELKLVANELRPTLEAAFLKPEKGKKTIKRKTNLDMSKKFKNKV